MPFPWALQAPLGSGWELWTPLPGPGQNCATHPLLPTTFGTVGLGWVAGGAEEELSR